MKIIACVIVVGVAMGLLKLMFSNINFFEKYNIRKTKGAYEIFDTKLWLKIEKTKNVNDVIFFTSINSEVAEWDKEGLFAEEDREKLNKRIKELNFIMEKFRGGDKEHLALKQEIKNLGKDLEEGMYFREYRKNIKEGIEAIKKINRFIECRRRKHV